MTELRIIEAIDTLKRSRKTSTASMKEKKQKKALLRESVASVQLFLSSNPLVKGWTSATVLGNLAVSIASGLDDDEIIPDEDVEEYSQSLTDFNERYSDYVSEQDDLEEDDLDSESREADIENKKKEANKVLRTNASALGLKALALVSGDIEQIFNMDNVDENDDRTVQTSLHKLNAQSKYHSHHKAVDASIKDDDYRKIERQLENVEPYIQKMRSQLPRRMKERFVLLHQPIIIVGSLIYKPTSRALNYVAHNGIDLGGYWMLKNQIVLGVATDPSKLAKDPAFRKMVEDRLRDVYQADLDNKISKMKSPNRNAIHKLRTDNERYIKDELEEEIELLLKQTNVDTLVKLISKKLKYQVVEMPGTARVTGSPYIYYWLVSDEMKRGVVDGLYSDITGWDLAK